MRTNRHPGDYDRRVPTPPAELFATCPACGYHVAVKAGYVKEGLHKGSAIINCYQCNTLDQIELSPEERTKKAACSICTLAQAMRVCKVCAFGAYAEQHNKPDPLEFSDDWAADPEWVKSLDDPNQSRREEWQGFLSRMNAPEMVARRGTELTPYGWRVGENEPLRDDEFQYWNDEPGSP